MADAMMMAVLMKALFEILSPFLDKMLSWGIDQWNTQYHVPTAASTAAHMYSQESSSRVVRIVSVTLMIATTIVKIVSEKSNSKMVLSRRLIWTFQRILNGIARTRRKHQSKLGTKLLNSSTSLKPSVIISLAAWRRRDRRTKAPYAGLPHFTFQLR